MEHENLGNATSDLDPVSVMSLKDWLISIFLTCIPVVGFIMLIIWAVSETTNENKRNWARAFLIIQALSIILAVILYVAVIASALALYHA
jgi:hypothetical protein